MSYAYKIQYNPYLEDRQRVELVFACSVQEAIGERFGNNGIKVMPWRGDEKQWVQKERPDIKIWCLEGDKDRRARYYRLPEWVKRPI